jgi:hypothetical protein
VLVTTPVRADACATRIAVIPRHSRPKDGFASLA